MQTFFFLFPFARHMGNMDVKVSMERKAFDQERGKGE